MYIAYLKWVLCFGVGVVAMETLSTQASSRVAAAFRQKSLHHDVQSVHCFLYNHENTIVKCICESVDFIV